MENILLPKQLEDIKQRVLAAYSVSELGELAKILAIPYQILQHHFMGRTPLPAELLFRFSEDTHVSSHWILTGEGEKHPGSNYAQSQQLGSQLVERREKQRDIFNLVAQFNDLPDQVKVALSNKIVGLVANHLLTACDIVDVIPEPVKLSPLIAADLNQTDTQ
jgi:hypothetical protein